MLTGGLTSPSIAAARAETERCVRQVDRVLLVADATASSDRGPIERRIEDTNAYIRRDLVLVHPPGTELPSDSARWRSPRSTSSHFHVRAGNVDDMRRLARTVGPWDRVYKPLLYTAYKLAAPDED